MLLWKWAKQQYKINKAIKQQSINWLFIFLNRFDNRCSGEDLKLSGCSSIKSLQTHTLQVIIFISYCCSNVIKYISHMHFIALQTVICGIYVPFVSGLTTTCMQCILWIRDGLRSKGLCTLQTKVPKMQLSSIQYTLQLFATIFSTV